jgi:hypothetical protein
VSVRGKVATAGAVILGIAVLTEHYAVVAGVLVAYCLWMLLRDWLDRREKYSGWTRTDREG